MGACGKAGPAFGRSGAGTTVVCPGVTGETGRFSSAGSFTGGTPGRPDDGASGTPAPPVAGVLKTSPGRWSGQDSGWALMMALPPFEAMMKSMKEFPNIAILNSPALVGVDRPKFVPPPMRFYTGD